ncbi:pyridoxamine 5'-phosphate oxidase family protein [Candidatus Binatus soli]|uniref:pyridoxamine 5'-phosphate oxidase family protein n=1 Tax=Candidatus Binatus soli TaxID=1953413 RepID=UPI003D145410
MLIQELSREESLDLLARAHLGRLACAHKSQPYVVPFYFAYDNEYLYSFSTVGQKIEWMRANPKVCVEADEVVNPQQWVSVIVFGRYEELPNIPEWRVAREYARKKLLERNAIWWEPGYAKTILHETERPLAAFFFRIHIVEITGRRATPEPVMPPGKRPSMTGAIGGEWLQKILRPVRKQT